MFLAIFSNSDLWCLCLGHFLFKIQAKWVRSCETLCCQHSYPPSYPDVMMGTTLSLQLGDTLLFSPGGFHSNSWFTLAFISFFLLTPPWFSSMPLSLQTLQWGWCPALLRNLGIFLYLEAFSWVVSDSWVVVVVNFFLVFPPVMKNKSYIFSLKIEIKEKLKFTWNSSILRCLPINSLLAILECISLWIHIHKYIFMWTLHCSATVSTPGSLSLQGAAPSNLKTSVGAYS